MKKGLGWPIGIATILLLTVAANVWVFVVAGDDPSFAIEPDYYAKAVAWDSTLAQARRNETLRWQLAPKLAGFSPRDGAQLSVSLTDSAGQPISGATIKVFALFNARAANVLASTLHADSAGYSTRLAVNHRGEWELRFDVRRGDDHFTADVRVIAEPVSGPGV
jgi:hypothetical protein